MGVSRVAYAVIVSNGRHGVSVSVLVCAMRVTRVTYRMRVSRK